MDIGTKDHPKDRFSNPLEEGDTVAFLSYGDFLRGTITAFTPKAAKVLLRDGFTRTVLRDKVVGPRSLEEVVV